MISFRYHVVTVVAILFALAAGVVLGHGMSTTTASPTVSSGGTPSTSATSAPSADVTALKQQIADEASFIEAVGPRVVAGSLTGTTVVVVVAPGADTAIVSGLSQLLPATGATVVGRVDLGSDATDPGSRQLVDELTTQLVKSTKGVRVPGTVGTYERLGAVLGFAFASTDPAGTPMDSSGQTLSAGLSAGRLATTTEDLAQKAGLVLLVAPSGSVTDTSATGTIIASIAKGLGGQSAAVMLVAGRADGQPAAAIEALRVDPQATSVVASEDAGDLGSGQIAALLGLAAAADGTVGQYGLGKSAGALVP